jgi:hypothetical protein
MYINSKASFRTAISKYLGIPVSNTKQLMAALFFGAQVPTMSRATYHFRFNEDWTTQPILKLIGNDYDEAIDNLEKLRMSKAFMLLIKSLNDGKKIVKEHGSYYFIDKFGGDVKKLPITNTDKTNQKAAKAYQGFESYFMSVLIKFHDGNAITIHDQFYSDKPIEESSLEQANKETGFNMTFSSESEHSPEKILKLLKHEVIEVA